MNMNVIIKHSDMADIPTNIPRTSQTIYDNIPRIVVFYFCWSALFLILIWLSKLLIVPVRTLKSKEQMFWGLSMIRAICGSLVVWAIHLIFIDQRLSINPILATTDESWTFICLIIGFFIFEEITLIYFDLRYRTFSKELHAHHLISFNGYFLTALFGTNHYIAISLFFLEGSTPFSCICWCLLKLKLENTFIWKANQWLLIYIFHARTLVELWCWYTCYQNWAIMKQYSHVIYIVSLFFGLASSTLWLTPYWTYKKTKQFFYPIDWNAEIKKKKN